MATYNSIDAVILSSPATTITTVDLDLAQRYSDSEQSPNRSLSQATIAGSPTRTCGHFVNMFPTKIVDDILVRVGTVNDNERYLTIIR